MAPLESGRRGEPMAVDIFEPEAAVVVNCCMCGRFVSTAEATRHTEMGDYGTVYSVEFECRRCAAASTGERSS